MDILHSKILGNGTPLLILHGFLGMGDNWKTLGNRFSESYEVHLIDQRNHGRSFHTNAFSYELLVQDLLTYITYYQLEKIVLLGHSMGGKTSMLFAVRYPDKVEKLIVGDIGPKFYPNHHENILEGLAAVNFSEHTSRKAIEAVLSTAIFEPGVRQFLLKNVYRLSKDVFNFRFNLDSLTRHYDEVGVGLPPQSLYKGATLFLKGENSDYISDADESLIRSHFPSSEIRTVKSAGHWLHAENPDDFYDYVVSFLGK